MDNKHQLLTGHLIRNHVPIWEVLGTHITVDVENEGTSVFRLDVSACMKIKIKIPHIWNMILRVNMCCTIVYSVICPCEFIFALAMSYSMSWCAVVCTKCYLICLSTCITCT